MTVQYRKAEEHFLADYAHAEAMAEALFQQHSSGQKDSTGSRTNSEAKVRIRRRNSDTAPFRVVLLKPEQKAEKAAIPEAPRKRQRRHRNDRKGKRQRRNEQTS